MNLLKRAFRHSDLKIKFSYTALVLSRVFLSTLDLIGLALVGVSVNLLIGSPQALATVPIQFSSILSKLEVANSYAVYALIAAVFFILKSLLTIALHKLVLSIATHLEASASRRFSQRYVFGPVYVREGLSNSDYLYALNRSTHLIFGQTPSLVFTLIGEISFAVLVSAYLSTKDFPLFLGGLVYLLLVFLFLNNFVTSKMRRNSKETLKFELSGQQILLESLESSRQIAVAGRTSYFIDKYVLTRTTQAAKMSAGELLSNLPRHIIEFAIVLGVGGFLVSRSLAPQYLVDPATLAIFVTGAIRLLATTLPIQSSIAALKVVAEQGKLALELDSVTPPESKDRVVISKPRFEINNLSFSHRGSKFPTISNLTGSIPFGSLVSITGKSGEGKSTFVELLMGLRAPSAGELSVIDNLGQKFQPSDIVFGFVPQKTSLLHSTLLDNIVQVSDPNISAQRFSEVIDLCHLDELVDSLPDGLKTEMGDGSRELSGQLQRISIARALLTNSSILVLDEATNSLDAETESAIAQVIDNLRGQRTIFVISHESRLHQNADFEINITKGKCSFIHLK